MKYAVKITNKDGSVSYLSVNGKTSWSKRSYAQRHIDDPTTVKAPGQSMVVEPSYF